ncbi:MAG: DUF3570 domain-containing protein [Halieaceae bacterium]|jgi:hypothetical protein|nr:DUF3570 domain-containing protein [Halieaceae bacterium]
MRSNSPLLALTSSALLLPAYQPPVQADAPPTEGELGLRYSKYSEDDLHEGRLMRGDHERYEIDITQAHLLAPVGENFSFALDVQKEHMSGASPWFVGVRGNGDIQVYMSGASISDTRTDISVTTRYYFPRGNVGLNYANSSENDYKSDALTVDAAWNSSDGQRSFRGAISGSDDHLKPTEGRTPIQVERETRDMRSVFLGASQIISKQAIIQFGLSYTVLNGYLTDPYKRNDLRPDERKQWAASIAYRQFLPHPGAALHLDYRFYDDDWGINSHTLEASWHQRIHPSLRLVPYARYYSQSEADFFTQGYRQSKRYYADDYRLSSFGALTLGARMVVSLKDWDFTVVGERYRSDNSWSLYSGDESPALVDFWRFSVGFNYSFN